MPHMHRLPNEPDCNVVDVQGDDGMFQRGKIVDCVQGGLIVDWECNGYPAPPFVSFQQVYRNIFEWLGFRDEHAIDQGRTSMEILMYRNDKEPRTWYPGTLLAVFSERYCRAEFGLVQAALPNGPVTIVARGHRIRTRKDDANPGLKDLRVQKDQFVKHRLRLPKGYNRGAASAQQIVDILNQTSGGPVWRTRTLIRAVSMDDKTLAFIAVGNNYIPKRWRVPLKTAGDKLRSLLEEAAKIYEARKERHKRKLSEADLESSEEGMRSDIPFAADDIKLLPRDVLGCVLEYLDSADQSRLRRVCSYWNCMLTLPCFTQTLRVSYSNKSQSYLSVASLHHAWTPETKVIISAHFCSSDDVIMHSYSAASLFCGGPLFRTLMHNGLHAIVERLVLSDVFWSMRADEINWIHNRELVNLRFSGAVARFVEELNGLACACQNLILRNVKVHVSCGVRSRKFESIRILTGRVDGCLTVNELWSRMDASLPPLDHVQRQQVSIWINRFPEKVLHMLNDIQSRDPRDDANYRNRVWTVDDLDGLETDKLSKVTLYNLAN